jgi:hypothetical protein
MNQNYGIIMLAACGAGAALCTLFIKEELRRLAFRLEISQQESLVKAPYGAVSVDAT